MRRIVGLVAASVLASAFLSSANAADKQPLELDGLFRDHMILPRHDAVVSGWTQPGGEITVSFFNTSQIAQADDKGRFAVKLPDFEPGKSGTLSVAAATGERIDVSDVLSGDVYLCSGQSNMEMSVNNTLDRFTVIMNSANDQIRMATVAPNPQPLPQERFGKPVAWESAGPKTVGNWSATCYFFGAELQKRVKVPIGLVHASLGGANITTFMSPKALLPDYATQENLLALYATDPAKAGVEFGHSFEQWWQTSGGSGTPWTSTAADLKTWKDGADPSLNWEKWGVRELADYNGSLWYAATVTLTPDQAAKAAQKAATLQLGTIDDIDQTWLNGQPVGFTAGGGTQRAYSVPLNLLKAGDNAIVINVVDVWAYGGMFGDGPRQLTLADGTVVPLTGWRWQPVPPAQKSPPRSPWDSMGGVSILSNGMIAPMGPFAFAGAVWYQGESNAGSPYQGLLRGLFKDWRNQFRPEMTFAVVQLANFGPRASQPGESGWARLREDQRLAVLADGNATLATAIDLGDPGDIHPANKRALGERLARAMAIRLYGFNGSESGPQIKSAVRDGDRIVLSFDGMEGDFIAYGATRPIGFELCTRDACRYAEADIEGRLVILKNAADANRVRFCWADSPTCTLYDGKSGLPALPFEQAVP